MLGETMVAMACYELGEYDAMADCLERVMRLARQLGARRFEAQGLELQARVLLDLGRRGEAAALLREALAICNEAGTQFCGPKVISVLSRAVEDPAERADSLAEGMEMLGRGTVGHNYLWFHRESIEASLSAGDVEGVLRYAALLEDYTRAEPLPWSALFAARGRALAAAPREGIPDRMRGELARVQSSLLKAGIRPFLPAVEGALALWPVDAEGETIGPAPRLAP